MRSKKKDSFEEKNSNLNEWEGRNLTNWWLGLALTQERTLGEQIEESINPENEKKKKKKKKNFIE